MKSKLNPFLALIVFASAAQGAALTWDTATGDGVTITPGNGTWQTGSGNWNNAGADVNWTAGDTAIFAGADGTYTITIGGAVTTGNSAASGITFNNSGYTLTSATARTITLGNANATSAITVAASKTATIGGSVTVTKGASGNTGAPYITGGGTLILGGGVGDAALLQNTGSSPSEIRGGTTLEIKAGGTFTNGTSTIVGVGSGTAENGLTNHLKVTGGTVNVNTNNLIVGQLSGSQSSTAIVTISSGLIDIKGASGSLRLGQSSSGTADVTINLDGGAINTARVYENPGTPAVSTFNFNGGTLRNFATNYATAYMEGLDKAQIRNGAAIFDTNGFATTIAQNLLHSTLGGDNVTDGGVVKNGANTLNLTGTLSYTGPTMVNAGTLGIVAPNSSNSTTLNNAGSRLKVTSGASPSTLPSLTLNTDTGVNFDVGNFDLGHQPSLSVGTLNAVGNYVVDMSGSNIPFSTTITLLTYTSKTGSGVPSIGTLPPGVTLSGPPVDTGSSIQINVVNGSATAFTWSKGNGDWDLVSSNWNANADVYLEPSVVTFPNITGNLAYTVNLTATRSPSTVTFTNTGNYSTNNPYTFTGSGIAGSTGIAKNGSGLVTFSNPNSYTGNLNIASGSVVKTIADTTTGAINVTDLASFVLSGGVVDGSGQTLTVAGPGNISNYFYSGSGTQRGSLQAQNGANTWAGNIVLTGTTGTGGNTRIGVQNGASLTLSGNISEGVLGMSPFFRGGSSASDVITFSGTCSWTGPTRLFSDGGVFALGTNNPLPTASELAVGTSAGGAVFDLAGFNQSVAALSGASDAFIRNTGGTTSTLSVNPVIANTFNGIIEGDVALTVGGTAVETLAGQNTYSGNTTINSGAKLTILSIAASQFYPTTNGVTNSISGAGTLIYDGTLRIDTSSATTTLGNSWTLINKTGLTVTFGDGLSVISESGTFIETSAGSGIWTLTDGDSIPWTFTEADGTLIIGTPSTDPYAAWIGGFFMGETNPAVIGKGADPDNDGLNNFAEFALHGTPNSGSDNGYHVVAIEDTNANSINELTLTIAVRNGAGSPTFTGSPSPSASVDGVKYSVQGSLDLSFPGSAVSETALPTGLPALPTGWEYRRFRLDASDPLGSKGFLRVETQPVP